MNAEAPPDLEVIEAPPPSVTFASGGLSWTRVRTPRVLATIGKVCFGLGALGSLAFVWDVFSMVAITGLIGFFAWPLFILSFIVSLTQNAFGGGLEITKSELVIHTGTKRRHIALAKISGALVVEREVFGGFVNTVEIELTNGDVLTARLPDPRSAQAVVTALGFGLGGRRVHAALAKPTRRLLHVLLGVVSYVGGVVGMIGLSELFSHDGFSIGYALSPLLALTFYTALKRLVRAPEITVGDDGVLLKKAFGSRFVPRREIASVSAGAGMALLIERTAGEQIALGGVLIDSARRSAVARVIEERIGPSAATADRFAHYERAGRALTAWREHLAHAMNEASYRQNAATVEEAAGVLRSAQATPEQRVGAALALRVAGQPKERIRIAVEGAVDDRVREALEAVAETDDDVVIEKALRRLQPP